LPKLGSRRYQIDIHLTFIADAKKNILALIEEVERLQRENAYLTRKNFEDSGLIPLLRGKIIDLEGKFTAYEKAMRGRCWGCAKAHDESCPSFDGICPNWQFDFARFE
jgi:hypothetical protein